MACEQFDFFVLAGHFNHSLEAETELFEQFYRGSIAGRDNRQNSFQSQLIPRVIHHDGGGFKGVAFRLESFQKSEADVRVRQRIAFDQAAHSG